MSSIEWTDETWNPVVGCTRASRGCDHCYAVTMTHRLEAMGQSRYAGLTVLNNRGERHFNGVVRTVPEALDKPLRWRKPRRVFVNSMADLFHPDVPFEFIDRVFAVMALTPQHTYQVLTKRPERMAEYFSLREWAEVIADMRALGQQGDAIARRFADAYAMNDLATNGNSQWRTTPRQKMPERWPLLNVWLGTSVEDQAAAEARIPHLLRCPAAVRFLSCEPLLGPVDLVEAFAHYRCDGGEADAAQFGDRARVADCGFRAMTHPDDRRGKRTKTPAGGPGGRCACLRAGVDYRFGGIDWVIAGGESGPDARPCDVAWLRSIVGQCRDAGVPVFVKQLGAHPRWQECDGYEDGFAGHVRYEVIEEGEGALSLEPKLRDRKGGDPSEWPQALRVREMPGAVVAS